MISRKSRLIAKLNWWAAGASEDAIATALDAIQEPSFVLPSLAWATRWKRLARLLKARLAASKNELQMAKADAKLAREDSKRWKERWMKLMEKEPVDTGTRAD